MYGLPNTGGLNPITLLMMLIGFLGIVAGWMIKRFTNRIEDSGSEG
jgi:LPXTG-motif cell wall-anchored protein